MGKKIFVSYKFADSRVKNLSFYENSTVRDYVTKFECLVYNKNTQNCRGDSPKLQREIPQ